MPRLSVEETVQLSEQAWQRKSRTYGRIQECYRYAMPGANPYRSGIQSDGQTVAESDGGERGLEVYDSTGEHSAHMLATRLMSEAFPQGVNFAHLSEGAMFAPEEPNAVRRQQQVGRVEQAIFGAVHSSNFYHAGQTMVLDGIVTGTGIMRIARATVPGQIVFFEPVPQATVALEPGPFGNVKGFYRKLWLTMDDIREYWPNARIPRGMRPDTALERIKRRMTVHECTRWDPTRGVWYYDVITDVDGMKRRIEEDERPVAEWAAWRYSLAPGEVQGRGPVEMALGDMRTLSEGIRIRLESADLRSAGVWTYDAADLAFNPDTVEIANGTLIPVGSENTLRPLDLPGDYNLNELSIQDTRDAVRNTLLANALPPLTGPVRSATEIAERIRQAAIAFGSPFLRLVEEVGRPILRAVAYYLAEAGNEDLVASTGVDPRGQRMPLRLDGTDIAVEFHSPLIEAQRVADAQQFVLASRMAQEAVGGDAASFQAGTKVEDVPEMIYTRMGVPEMARPADERAAQLAQAQAAPAQAQLAPEPAAV